MESSGSKSLVFSGQPAYIFYVRFNHFRAVKFQENAFLIQGTVICAGFVPALLWGWVNAGTPLARSSHSGALGIDSSGVGCRPLRR
jgi:hypothetical protein